MATWPGLLPQCFLADGYAQGIADNVIRDQFETGPAGVRRRSTSAPFPVSGKMVMTTAEWELIEGFFNNSLYSGSLTFGFPGQGTSTSETWRVRFLEPPSRTYVTEGYWTVALALEVLGTVPPPTPLEDMLDIIDNLFGVYGTRLVTALGVGAPLIRLRRASDNDEEDFYAGTTFWLDSSEIDTWLEGSEGYVCRLYDQTGNGRDFYQWTAFSQPIMDITTDVDRPCIHFNKAQPHRLFATANDVLTFNRNRSAVSLIAVRKHDSGAEGLAQVILHASSQLVNTNAKSSLQLDAADLMQAVGRRLNADSIDGPPGLPGDTEWGVQIGRFNYATADAYHAVDAASESDLTFQTAGNSQDVNSAGMTIGAGAENLRFFDGKLTLAAFVTDFITDGETAQLIAALAEMKL